ncbi:MAG: S41 family peptidase [Bacteroidetes bacterium]|nr:S41 family peptidase [Bacteroidota bacterium]
MNKIFTKITTYLPILFALVLITGIYIGREINPSITLDKSLLPFKPHSKYDKLSDILNYIEQDYVDSISREHLTRKAVKAIIEELDPHTSYTSKEEFNAANDPLLGSFEGIGVQFNIIEDTIAIIHAISGGPSEKSGILAGDRIIMVDDSLVAGVKITNRGAIRKLKGPKGTKVKVGVLRKRFPELIDFVIERNIIPTYSLDIAYMVNDTVGYMKLNTFSATTYDEFSVALKRLKEEGLTNLILDLRGNSGGFVKPSVQIADDFLSVDKLIVYTKGNSRPKNSIYSKSGGLFESEKLVILIDEASASASEILAGAVQDNDRATIIGRRSYGKGLVQEQLPFPDGSAIRMTIARYYTPTGRSIQKPYGENFSDYYQDFYHRIANGELQSADSIKFIDSLKFVTPGGKIVYGGGGIMPDIFVPIELDSPAFYNIIVNRGLAYRFAFNYTDDHRESLRELESFEAFNTSFEFTDKLFSEFVEFAKSNGVERSISEVNNSKAKLKLIMKAYIGRNLLDNEAFYPVFHKMDPIFIKAKSFMSSI